MDPRKLCFDHCCTLLANMAQVALFDVKLLTSIKIIRGAGLCRTSESAQNTKMMGMEMGMGMGMGVGKIGWRGMCLRSTEREHKDCGDGDGVRRGKG